MFLSLCFITGQSDAMQSASGGGVVFLGGGVVVAVALDIILLGYSGSPM